MHLSMNSEVGTPLKNRLYEKVLYKNDGWHLKRLRAGNGHSLSTKGLRAPDVPG